MLATCGNGAGEWCGGIKNGENKTSVNSTNGTLTALFTTPLQRFPHHLYIL